MPINIRRMKSGMWNKDMKNKVGNVNLIKLSAPKDIKIKPGMWSLWS